ncbi:trypsin-like serine protease [Nitratireductor mangrovi]|uniref:Serine protease n=1 Tax=Nitratireductor mangrovi TaxID=2599600 RepID=A0A5B8L5H9_9HYPH|nr:trypsin-like serine protease [Nitratireductor mangrovi]QDZ03032.1 trypsin-like serine protease [Nitratireductor mangrovi]
MQHSSRITRLQAVAAVLAASVAFSAPAFADGEDDGFAGADGAPPLPQTSAEFDDREQFVPPLALPIEDTYIKEALSRDLSELREDLTAVSITPDGKVEELAPDDAMLERMVEAIEELEGDAGFEGGDEGVNEDDSAFESDSVQSESVIGADTRVKVNGTTSYPYRTVGRIDIGCTGTLIGPRHVLTAGHCVYNISNDKWYSSLAFSPGQNGATRPWGKIAWKRAVSVKGWTKSHKRDYDYAMIVLSQDIGNTVGWMGYGWKNPMPKYNVNINGYPGDKPSGTMWHAFCGMKIITTYRLYYPCDTFGGMSGSGVYVYWASQNKRTIYGIHAYGVDSTGYNGATRIRKAVFENLKGWKAKY